MTWPGTLELDADPLGIHQLLQVFLTMVEEDSKTASAATLLAMMEALPMAVMEAMVAALTVESRGESIETFIVQFLTNSSAILKANARCHARLSRTAGSVITAARQGMLRSVSFKASA